MNRNTILGFVGGLTFAASLVIGLVVADAATDQGGGEAVLPGTLGPPVEVVAGTPISDPDSSVPLDQPIEPSQAAYVPVETGGGGGSSASPSGGGGGSPSATGSDGATPGGITELTVAPLRPDPFAPVGIDPGFTGSFMGDLFFDFPGFEPFRFLDLCADDGALPGCPFGVGGTVLFPLGGGGLETLGDFRLGSAIRSVFDVRNDCSAHYPAAEHEHPLFVWANHPAVFEITYHWAGRPDLTETVTTSNADAEHPEFVRWIDDAVEGRLASSAWPRECFLLTEIPITADGAEYLPTGDYLVEVDATSFAGETASKTYSFNTGTGVRPPTYFWDRDDNNIDVMVPKKSGQSVGLSVVHEGAATSCADLEGGDWDFTNVIPAEESGFLFTGLTESIEQGPDWPYDRAYDQRETINVVDLEEGTTYLTCIWWFEAAERSFDDAVVVDREMRWITTPNRLTANVSLFYVDNFTDHALEADSYEVGFSCASDPRSVTFPPADMIIHEHISVPGTPTLCDYAGRQIRVPTNGYFITPTGTRQTFSLALDPRSPRGQQTFEVEMSTPEEPGPTVTLIAHFTEGSDSGTDSWSVGLPLVFESLPEEPAELPTEIQIDIHASGVDPDGRDGIGVTAQFDRPVRLSASLLGEPCLTGAEPSFASSGLSQTYSFRLDGLCLRTRYSVVLEVEDAAGNTATFADIAPGLPEAPGARYFRGTGWTDGYHVSYAVGNTGLSTAYSVQPYVAGFDVSVGGERFDMRRASRCLLENLPDAPGYENRGGSPDAVWGDSVDVTVSFLAEEPSLTDASLECTRSERFRHETWIGSVSSTLPSVAGLTIGEEFEMRVPIPAVNPYDAGSTLGLELVIVGTVTG